MAVAGMQSVEMKILLVIDNLGPGGAQRQIFKLAVLLSKKGYEVQMVAYHDSRFYDDRLAEHGIPVTRFLNLSPVKRILKIRKFIREFDPETVVAYLHGPSIIAELSTIPIRKFRLIVSERTGKVSPPTRQDRIRFQCHRLADAVVTNSHHLREYVNRYAQWLRHKTSTIVNCVDLDKFARNGAPDLSSNRIVVLARVQPEKNPLNIIRAAHILKLEGITKFRINWYGNAFYRDGKPTQHSGPFREAIALRKELGVYEHVRFFKPETDVRPLFHSHSAALLASNYEGFSNTLGEAAASHLPLLAANVCDNPVIAREGENGFLFDPSKPNEIASSIRKFIELNPQERTKMGSRSRELAEELLSEERFIGEYLELFNKLGAVG